MTLPSRISSALSAATLAGLLLVGCGSGHAATPASAGAGSAASATQATASTASTGTARPRLVVYETRRSPGVFVHRSSQVGRLHDAPSGFKRFVGRVADRVGRTSDCDAVSGVTVSRLRTDGFAVGGVNECGGYAALWGKVDGRWKQLQGTQDTWDCGVLRRHRVPSSVVGHSCFSYHGDHETHRYDQP